MVNIPPAEVVLTKKRIAVLLDGTWNTVNDNTNVWRLKSLLAAEGRDGIEQFSYYSTGVGSVFGERFRGGMFGYGLNDEIIRALSITILGMSYLFSVSAEAPTRRGVSPA